MDAASTDTQTATQVRAYLLQGDVVLEVAPGLPHDRITLALSDDGKSKPLKILAIQHGEPGTDGWTSLAFTTDLADLAEQIGQAGRAGQGSARLHVRLDGDALADQALPDAASPVLGVIEGVTDYSLTGWAADWRGHDLPACVLLLDGVEAAEFPSPTLHHALHRHASHRSCGGFRVPLPPAALDGASHHLALRLGTSLLPGITWRADPCFGIGGATREGVGLWFFDRGLADTPVTISLTTAGKLITRNRTGVHGDLEREGRRQIGFATRASLPDGRVELRAGEHAQLLFATLHVTSPATALASLRRVAGQLRTLQTELGSIPGWSRDMLADLRHQVGLAQGLPPRVVPHIDGRGRPVAVIVPIYKGLAETEACVASLKRSILAGDAAIAEVLLLNDASPEPGMAELLASHAGLCGHAVLRVLTNPKNLGFVGTINRGLAEAGPDADVLLLNADTEVPEFLVRRLKAAAYSRDDIASVTPLSNDATILSLPDRNGANALDSTTATLLDRRLSAARRPPLDVPVGVGFCLFIKRDALADVGGFSPEWQRGYCEEVDWCLRAADRGWTHVAATDTLVFHKGNVSFGAAERADAVARNHPLLEQRYPEYLADIRAFQSADQLAELRIDSFCALLAANTKPCVLHFTHTLGGGTAVLVEALADSLAATGHVNVICARQHDDWLSADIYTLRWREGGLSLRVPADRIVDTITQLLGCGLPGVQARIHSLLGVGPAIRDIVALPGLPYLVHVHDYQWYCPRVVLVDQTGEYCGEPNTRYCQLCVRAAPFHDFAEDGALITADIDAWIAANHTLLAGAAAVIVPSWDTARRFRQRFALPNLACQPHPEPVPQGRITRAPDHDRITRIALLGGISRPKGMDVLRDLGMLIDDTGAPVRFTVIGPVETPALFDDIGCISITGPYQRGEAAELLRRVNPHFVLFPAVWPETYSFALSESWAAGYPALAFDIGAIAERIREAGAGLVLPFETMAAPLLDRLQAARTATGALFGHNFVIRPAGQEPME